MQPVTFTVSKERTRYMVSPNTYAYAPNGKFPWLQRFLFKILGKLNARAKVPFTTRTYETPHFSGAHKQLLAAISEVRKRNVEPNVMYMGPNEYMTLLNGVYPPGGLTLDIAFKDAYKWDNKRDAPKFYGIAVRVLPWMSGVLVTPEKYDVTVIRPE